MKKILLLAVICLLAAPLIYAAGADAVKDIDIYSAELLSAQTPNLQELQSLANNSYQSGDYELAAKYYIAFLKYKPGDANALYNLACCYGLLGKSDFASQRLMQSFKAGFEDLEHIAKDTDFDKVRKSKDFAAAMDSLNVWTAKKANPGYEQSFYSISTYLPYRIYLPQDYSEDGTYRLLVGLHGYGDSAAGFGALYPLLKDKSIIYVVPEAPYILEGSGNPGYSWTPSFDENDPIQMSSFEGLNEGITNLVREVRSTYNIDKTILFGFSQGCFETYNIGLGNQDLFDGIIAFGGWLMPEIIGDALDVEEPYIKVFIGHGTTDNVVEYSSAEDALKLLKSKDYNVKMSSFEGAHKIDRKTFMEGLNWVLEE